MKRKQFRTILSDKLTAKGIKVRTPKLRGTMKRTARYIANEKGKVRWDGKYMKAAVNFYHDKKTKLA